jgi:hypothetical protein
MSVTKSVNMYKKFSAICVQNFLIPEVMVAQKNVEYFSNINTVKMRCKTASQNTV